MKRKLLAVAVGLLAASALSYAQPMGPGMMGWGDGWSWLGVVHMVLWWFLIILGIVVLAKWLFGGARQAGEDRALGVLRERYARGEIGKEEFEQKRRDLT